MLYNNQDFNMDQSSMINGDNNYVDQDMNVDINVGGVSQGSSMGNQGCPIVEPMQERVVNRTFCHEVPQDCQFM